MTSVLPEEESSVVKMKQKLISKSPVKEETRSFLNFSRENLNISHSNLEQGFNKSRLIRPSRNTILSVTALIVAILCLGLETWKLHCSLWNTREIEQLKRDVESLKDRFLEQDLMHELKILEEQLYPKESIEDNDADETDVDNADYDSNYDDDGSVSYDYSGDYHTPLTSSSSSDFPEITSTSIPISTSPDPTSSNKAFFELLAALHKLEAKHEGELEKNLRENYKNIEREHLKKEHKPQLSHEEKINAVVNNTKYKRDVAGDTANTNYIKEGNRSKRSLRDYTTADDRTMDISNRHERRFLRRTTSRVRPYTSSESNKNDNFRINSTPHPPKKYYAHSREETYSTVHNDQLSEEIIRPDRHGRSESMESGERVNWRNAHVTGNRTGVRRSIQNFEVAATLHRRLIRGNLRAPRQVYAIHYGADSALFSTEDEHTGNGRARHNNGIFKAWQPSDWVADLGMNRHFTLATDGKLTVHESGLYLVYAQIHYLDQHDENGFHLLVNGSPVLQCMVYSPGTGHKSRSCFSAQVTVLQAGDYLTLKDVGSARYTLFQRDKSFFGLVKLGELRTQQRHQSQQLTHQ